MILYDILGTEDHPTYRRLELDNLARQYDFLRSVITAAIDSNHRRLSPEIIAALNYHAIACLHAHAGADRPHDVHVGEYHPPQYQGVPQLMAEFIDEVNNMWEQADAISLASYCLWRLNHIHPFVNGNGRTARALCYYVLCTRIGGALPGTQILPDLIKENRDEYVALLREVDAAHARGDEIWLLNLTAFVARLLRAQFQEAGAVN